MPRGSALRPRGRARALELTWELAKTDWKLRYTDSWLGALWGFLKPLLIFLVLYAVFSRTFAPGVPHYGLWLLVGIVLWNAFAEGTILGLQSLLAKGHILSRIAISPGVIVAASIVHTALSLALTLTVLVGFFAWQRISPSPLGLAAFLAASLLTLALAFGCTLLLAPLFVRYRDLRQVWEIVLTLGFYATPIIYPLAAVPERLRPLFTLNPLTLILQGARTALLETPAAALPPLAVAAAVVGSVLAVGLLIFRRTSPFVAEHL